VIAASRPAEAQRILDAHGERAWSMLVERYGKTFRHLSLVVTCEPSAVRAVLMDRAHVEKRPTVHKLMAMLPGARGVLFLDGEPWLTRARALAMVFHRQNVADASTVVHDIAARHVSSWARAGRGEDLYTSVQQLGADAVVQIGFGFDSSDPRAAALAASLVAYKNGSMDPRPEMRFDKFTLDSATIVRCPYGLFRLWRYHRKVRAALRAAMADGRRNGRPDWIGRLQDAKLSPRELANEVNHLYGAFNAIDYVTTCALWELARRLALVATIRGELADALGGREVPSVEDLKSMPALNGFILEIFRRYPVSMGIARQLGEPLEIGGETFPAGTQVLVLLHALHHHPEFWDDPWQIKPERWSSAQPRVPYSYVPFLLGARKCMGRDMAEQHLLLVLAAVIRRFNIAVFADLDIPPFMIPRFAAPIPFALSPV
jgi:cytochrome P450